MASCVACPKIHLFTPTSYFCAPGIGPSWQGLEIATSTFALWQCTATSIGKVSWERPGGREVCRCIEQQVDRCVYRTGCRVGCVGCRRGVHQFIKCLLSNYFAKYFSRQKAKQCLPCLSFIVYWICMKLNLHYVNIFNDHGRLFLIIEL